MNYVHAKIQLVNRYWSVPYMMNGQSVVDWAVYAGSLHLEAERLPPATAR